MLPVLPHGTETFADSHAMLLKPCLKLLPAIKGFSFAIGRAIIGEKGVRCIRINSNFRFTAAKLEAIAHLFYCIEGNARILTAVK